MSLDLLNNEPESAPKTFARGQTLEFVMELPKYIPAGFFSNDELRSKAVLSFALLGGELPEVGTPQFEALIKHPGNLEVVHTAAFDTDVPTTVANLAALITGQEHGLEEQVEFIDKTLVATADGTKIVFKAKKSWADMNEIWVSPRLLSPDAYTVVRSHLTGGGPSRRAKGSFLLNSDGAEGTTFTLSVRGHEATFERTSGLTLAQTAAGLAAAAMAVPDIAELVTVTSSGARVILEAAYEGVNGDDIYFQPSSDSGAYDCPVTLYGGVNGADADPVYTSLASKLRLLDQTGPAGLVADLNPAWEDGSNATKIRFLVEDTDNWPLGPACFDVLFTRVVVTEENVTVESWNVDTKQVMVDVHDIPTVGSYILDAEGQFQKITGIIGQAILNIGDGTWEIALEVADGTFDTDHTAMIGTGKKFRSAPVSIVIEDGVT